MQLPIVRQKFAVKKGFVHTSRVKNQNVFEFYLFKIVFKDVKLKVKLFYDIRA